MTGRMALPITD